MFWTDNLYFIPSIDKLRIVSMSLHFVNEAKLGCKMSIFTSDPILSKKGVEFFVKSVVDGQTNVVAQMEFIKI